MREWDQVRKKKQTKTKKNKIKIDHFLACFTTKFVYY